MSKIKIGTAGWNDRVSGSTPAAKLRNYSEEFPLVEVDSSYYGIPKLATIHNWVDNTPDDFTFNVKAFRAFTYHNTPRRFLPPEVRPEKSLNPDEPLYPQLPERNKDALWEIFDQAIDPLHVTGKLGVVIFQFPYTFEPAQSNLEHISECRERLADYRVGVEFRNRGWIDGRDTQKMFQEFTNRDLLYVGVDSPEGLKTSIPPIVDTRGGLCVIRFHGHNAEGWNSTGPDAKSERTNYLYSHKELEDWVHRIRSEVEPYASEIHLTMNLNEGVTIARQLAALLGEGLRK